MNKFIISILTTVFGLAMVTASHADQLLLADKPVVNAGTSDVLPNIMFILDDSGSMSWTHMPDRANNFRNDYGYQSSHCNGVYYDPNITYNPPYNPVLDNPNDSSDSPYYPDANFTSAEDNGFDPDNSTNRNLNNGFVANRYSPDAANGWYGGGNYAAMGAVYYEYTGAVTDKDYNNNGSAFYQECNTSLANNSAVFTQHRLSTTVNATIDVGNVWTGGATDSVSSVRICATCTNLLTATATGNDTNALANSIVNNINNNSGTTGVTAARAGSLVTLTANNANEAGFRDQPLLVTANGWFWYPDTGWQNNIVRVGAFADNDPGNLTNYANWYSYYRTRMQMMKSSVSLAFEAIDNRYRVGLTTLNTANTYVSLAKFELGGHKNTWFAQLSSIDAQPRGTPLRSSLADAGRLYAGKGIYGNNDDPVEYACQANFSLVTTDGYWNTDNANDVQDVNGAAIGNLDGNGTPRPQYEGGNATSGTLADVAKYYYDTDIRDGGFNNCTGALGENVCGAEGDHLQQNMVTLSLGLGADGTLVYQDNYQNQSTGDYNDINSGAKNWPVPVAGQPSTIDDLWHAAVNGGGTYYSAKDPESLKTALFKGLSQIKATNGVGAAAAASNLAPVAGDNFAYIASYRTVSWTGNVEAREIDLSSFEISKTATWCAESVPADACAQPAVAESINDANGQTKWYCRTPNSDTANCNNLNGQLGIGQSATSCYVEIANSCDGTLQDQVRDNSRNILISQNGVLSTLNSAGDLTSNNITLLDNGLTNLTQWATIKDSQPSGSGTLENDAPLTRVGYLVDYLRGSVTYENQPSNTVAENKLFRDREHTLGDITESAPKFIGPTNLQYVDPGYANFRTALDSRQKAVIVGANDGMLHAFDAQTGNELWAYIPEQVIKNLPKLADSAYGTATLEHVNLVNGSPKIFSVCVGGCNGAGATWRSILVSGLNGGGRGYYALDVTDPASPSLLWDFDANDDPDLGFTFGEPVAVKLDSTAGANAGKWVILVTSGYNNGAYEKNDTSNSVQVVNTPQGSGVGYLYVLDAASGAVMSKIATNVGTPTSPSGLGKISASVVKPFVNNTVKQVYGADLDGNLFRFNPNLNTVTRIASLTSTDGTPQPVTTAPEIATVKDKPVVFVATGKYLELSDVINTQVQSVYALKDDNIVNPITLRGNLVQQTLTDNGNTRSATDNEVDFENGLGWMIDFLPGGELVEIDPLLFSGVLLVASNVPDSTSCTGSGFGWFNYFNYKTGGPAFPGSDLVSEKLDTSVAGFTIFYDSDGKGRVGVVGTDGSTQTLKKALDGGGSSERNTLFDLYEGSYGRRSSWRELIIEE